jgi:hypothetical protein
LPGPPPVSRCSLCSTLLDQWTFLNSLVGMTVTQICCNGSSGCTSSIPLDISTVANRATASIYVAHSKDDVRKLMGNRPNIPTVLLVTSRNVSGLCHTILKSRTPCHAYPSDSAVGLSMNVGCKKPSQVLVYSIPPDHRETAELRNIVFLWISFRQEADDCLSSLTGLG